MDAEASRDPDLQARRRVPISGLDARIIDSGARSRPATSSSVYPFRTRQRRSRFVKRSSICASSSLDAGRSVKRRGNGARYGSVLAVGSDGSRLTSTRRSRPGSPVAGRNSARRGAGVAQSMRLYGFEWTRATVAAYESGERAVSMAETLGLLAAYRTDLPSVLDGFGFVYLSPGVRTPSHRVIHWLSDGEAAKPGEDRAGRSERRRGQVRRGGADRRPPRRRADARRRGSSSALGTRSHGRARAARRRESRSRRIGPIAPGTHGSVTRERGRAEDRGDEATAEADHEEQEEDIKMTIDRRTTGTGRESVLAFE